MRLRRRRPSDSDLFKNIVKMVASALGLAIRSWFALWFLLGYPSIRVRGSWAAGEIFDSIKIAFVAVGDIGGVAALMVAYRKQLLRESTEKREDTKLFAERFTKAAEQVGSDKAHVRVAGMYALEQLAQSASERREQRQMIVNVICAYLRMPYPSPTALSVLERKAEIEEAGDVAPDGPDAEVTHTVRQQENGHGDEELHVRLTAQRILTAHLRLGNRQDLPVSPRPTQGTYNGPETSDTVPGTVIRRDRMEHPATCLMVGEAERISSHFSYRWRRRSSKVPHVSRLERDETPPVEVFWDEIDLDLSGATLFDIDLTDCDVHATNFIGARFNGFARFNGTHFHGNSQFDRASFERSVDFDSVKFCEDVTFYSVEFYGLDEDPNSFF